MVRGPSGATRSERPLRRARKPPGSARGWDSLMTWVTLSNGACPPFFPLEAGIFDLAGPLNSRGKRGVAPKQKCRGVHAPIGMLFRGKSVTHVMRSCRSRAALGGSPRAKTSLRAAAMNTPAACAPRNPKHPCPRCKRVITCIRPTRPPNEI